ncbi:MAG: serine/threonine-protein kinase [Myxococcota bacterium]
MNICQTCGACFDDEHDLCAYDGGLLESPFSGPRVLGDRYLLEQRMAAGAMGVVFRATHLQVGSTVAVKLMQPRKEELRVALARFHREAQILGQIKHPNAVLVMDFRVEQRGTAAIPYLVTEFLRGQSLETLLEQTPRLPLREVERIITPLCEAVEEAHQVGVVHRDIKPSNVFLERLRDGTQIVKVLDFGIAKFVELSEQAVQDRLALTRRLTESTEVDFLDEVLEVRGGAGDSSDDDTARGPITEAGFMVGTIPYMAPEQMTGGRVSRRTDVCAVGTLIWRLLAGRLPFEGDDDEVIAGRLSGERPSLREAGVEVPLRLDEILQRALSLREEDRPASVLELARELRLAVASLDGGEGAVPLPPQLQGAVATLGDLERELTAWANAPDNEEHYLQARERLLSLSTTLSTLARRLEQGGAGSDVDSTLIDELAGELDRLTARISRQLHGMERHSPAADEYLDYLLALWTRANVSAGAIVQSLRARLPGTPLRPEPGPALSWLNPLQSQNERALLELTERLESRDALDSVDALEALLRDNLDALVACLATGGDLARRLAQALWRHADTLLLLELHPSARAFRLLPILASNPTTSEAAPYGVLARLFLLPTDALVEQAAEIVEGVRDDEARAILWRCLLVHPLPVLRAHAAQRVPLSGMWNVIAYPRTPTGALRVIFARVKDQAPNEYLKVFFLCTRDSLQAVSHRDDLAEAFLLLHLCFSVPCFHEDIVFEPLLAIERTLRARCAALGVEPPADDAYGEALAEFQAEGVTETQLPETMRDIPLPIQRKLAREGHFLAYFVTHTNERVARETLPHLLRLEDVTRYLRIATIHRAVLTELARNKRLFRKDAPRLALLQNPKTPAHVARGFLPLVSREQLRLLAANKHIGAEVRQLASGMLERLGRMGVEPAPTGGENATVDRGLGLRQRRKG